MAKAAPAFTCTACGATTVRWAGKCTKCGQFGTVAEVASPVTSAGLKSSATGRTPATAARPVSEIAGVDVPRMRTGIDEFDRVTGGGLVAGQVLLLAGEPGAGKSTLLLNVADQVARTSGKIALYISAEESVEQIAGRARRIGADHPNLLLADDHDLAAVIGHLDSHGSQIALVIVDSVQTVASADVEGRSGGVAQVMEVASTLTRVAKARGIPMCLVGQVTKESTIAGPRSLEHIVDTTLSLDGDRHTSLRLLRAIKNRYGPADEVACFEQTDTGIVQVTDPSGLFRAHRESAVPGTCVTVTLEGRRPLLAEIQALVTGSNNPNPRRGVSGLDSSRAAMLTAITERISGVRLFDKDVFVATVGGMRITDPGADVATCVAIASAATDRSVSLGIAAIGEVTLSGDLRSVPMISQRIAEAVRLGFDRIIIPAGATVQHTKNVIAVGTLREALTKL